MPNYLGVDYGTKRIGLAWADELGIALPIGAFPGVDQPDWKNKIGEVIGEKKIDEINSGIYCFKKDFLTRYIKELDTSNAQGELYITDLIGIANNEKKDIVIVQVDEHSIQGINSMGQLNEVEDTLQKKIIQSFMEDGVYFQDPTSTYIDESVKISSGAKIFANSHIKGNTVIEENCEIGPNAQINDSHIGQGSKVINSVIDESKIESNGSIGPFAHIRPGSELADNVKVGAFAETKKSKIGKGSKINHLSYIGDALLGNKVNIGAGTVSYTHLTLPTTPYV